MRESESDADVIERGPVPEPSSLRARKGWDPSCELERELGENISVGVVGSELKYEWAELPCALRECSVMISSGVIIVPSSEGDWPGAPSDQEACDCNGGRKVRLVDSMSRATLSFDIVLTPVRLRVCQSVSEDGTEAPEETPLIVCALWMGALIVIEAGVEAEEVEVEAEDNRRESM